MFGIRFAKFEPGLYVFRYKKGKLRAQGEGLAFHYYAPTTSIVAVPVNSADAPFMFSDVSADFQELTIQGQLTYRIADPEKTAKLLNYTIDSRRLGYISDDPQKLGERLINLVLIASKGAVKKLSLKEAVVSSDEVAQKVFEALKDDPTVKSLGVSILSLSIAAVKPNPETAKALEAGTREEILKEADQAIFQRRNYAVGQERVIRENELNTEIAVEQKNREIQETRLATERLSMQKQLEMEAERLSFQIEQEKKNQELVELSCANKKAEADAASYALSSTMKIYGQVQPETLKAMAVSGLSPGRLMALAFQGLADKADKIGSLNITPDLLKSIIKDEREEV